MCPLRLLPLRNKKGLHNYIGNKNQGSENKIILRDFNCTMDKINRGGGNKTQIFCRCCSNYALSKLIMYNRLKDLSKRMDLDY